MQDAVVIDNLALIRKLIQQTNLPIEDDVAKFLDVIRQFPNGDRSGSSMDEVVGAFNVVFENSTNAGISAIPYAIEYGIDHAYRRDEVWQQLFRYIYMDDSESATNDSESVFEELWGYVLTVFCRLFWQHLSTFHPDATINDRLEITLNRPLAEIVPDLILEAITIGTPGKPMLAACYHHLSNQWLYRPVTPQRSANAIDFMIRAWNAPRLGHLDLNFIAEIYFSGKVWCAITDQNLVQQHLTLATPLLLETRCNNHIRFVAERMTSEKYGRKNWNFLYE